MPTIAAGTPSPPNPPPSPPLPVIGPHSVSPPSSPRPPLEPWHDGISSLIGDWGFTLEPWAGQLADGSDPLHIVLRGNQRGYITRRGTMSVQYEHFQLLDKTLSFSLDVSQVGCGCNAALYLVAMENPGDGSSRYCDILSGEPCVEIDLYEGNTKGMTSTLHTEASSIEKECNRWGCQAGYGPWDENCKYGAGSPNLDSRRPFEMAARFETDGEMTITAMQDNKVRRIWDKDIAHVPQRAFDKLKTTLEKGVVLVVSLWAASDMSWLDGGCSTDYPHCDLSSATAVFGNLRVKPNVPVPPGPPASPPPQDPPLPLRPPSRPLTQPLDQLVTSIGPQKDASLSASRGHSSQPVIDGWRSEKIQANWVDSSMKGSLQLRPVLIGLTLALLPLLAFGASFLLRSKLQRGSSTQILGALAPVATPLRDEHTILGQRKEHGVHVKGHNSKYEKLESGQREVIGSLT